VQSVSGYAVFVITDGRSGSSGFWCDGVRPLTMEILALDADLSRFSVTQPERARSSVVSIAFAPTRLGSASRSTRI